MKAHRSVFVLCASDHELPTEVSDRYRQWEQGIESRLRELVALAQDLGVVRPDIDPLVGALQLIHAPAWAADRLVAPGLLDIDTAVERILDLALHGLFPSSAP